MCGQGDRGGVAAGCGSGSDNGWVWRTGLKGCVTRLQWQPIEEEREVIQPLVIEKIRSHQKSLLLELNLLINYMIFNG